ncbi:MAG: DUF5615 family PIN-like protein [Bryobacterales bacterium]|nr:DUF5615 family PIN-like protein [Bryobacterales bacterium]
MKIKVDENLPEVLVSILRQLGHDVDSVLDESLGGHDDDDVWAATQATERFLITQDLDFSDVRRYTPGTHKGILLVRIGRPGRLALARRIGALFATELVEDWKGCLVVATDHKLRIKRPTDATL